MKNKPRTVAILAGGVISVSFAAIFIKLSTAPPLIISFYRMFFATLLILAYSAYRSEVFSELKKLTGKDFLLLLLAGFFLAVHFGFWVTSLSHTSVASSVVLVTTQPIFIVLIESAFLGKKPSKNFLIGLSIAAAGSFLIGFGDFRGSEFALIGDVLALLGAAMAAGYFLIGGEVRSRINVLPYVLAVYGISSIFLLLITTVAGIPLLNYSAYNFSIFLLLAIVPTLLGHTLLMAIERSEGLHGGRYNTGRTNWFLDSGNYLLQ